MRIEKTQLSRYVSDVLKDAAYFFLVSYKGLSVLEFSEFRNRLHSAGSNCHVFKNSLIRIGIENNKILTPPNFKICEDTSVVYGNGDPSSTAKVISTFGKEYGKVSFKAGFVNGIFLHSADAEKIADLPSKEILQSQLLGVLQAPMCNLLRVFNAKPASLVYLLQALIDKKEKKAS